MQVTYASKDRLVLVDRPWLFAGMVWAIGLAALWSALTGDVEANGLDPWVGQLFVSAIGFGSCLLAWWAFPFQEIVFDRGRRLIIRRVKRPLAPKVEEVPLAQFEKAVVGSNWDDGNRLERLELVLADRTWPLEWGYSSSKRGKIVEAINSWHAGEAVPGAPLGDARSVTGIIAGDGGSGKGAVSPPGGIPDTRRDLS